ncbi:minor tail protein [Mycobacterium phage Hawkeye]|uniref:Uncharacterized protein n=1 Tax=Mycobacterium phage Hawkeye TaxID=1458711 RepID=X2KSL7_9CAUD|nr:minor tail protein [Mycobacterium phage Hawkeye]AHN84041.1 hypothetical protein PBI_HAWKEYE_30 [Mycobacterium phage Hawkeye]
MSSNLQPGQYQIGNLIFGRGTMYPVSKVEIQSYNVQAQDFQVIQSDETQFGQDSFVPGPIVFEIGVLDFKRIQNVEVWTNRVFNEEPLKKNLNKLAAEWRGDDVRRNWGAMKALKCCERDGKVLVWYGRPRKFQASKRSAKSSFFTVQAEFQRADTLMYNDEEIGVEILKGAAPTIINRADGEAKSWLRIVGYGPLTSPVITIGDQEVALDISIAEGEAFEVSSYPWQRRAINNSGLNISSKLIGDTQYLDRLQLPPAGVPIPVRWTSDEINTWVPELGNQAWIETIDGVSNLNLPNTFNTIAGKVVVRFDLFNPEWAEKFIGPAIFGSTSACLYTKKTFATPNQYCEAKIVEPWGGRSAIVIMSNATMTNFAMLEVVSGIGNNKLRIRSGSAYNSYSAVQAEWTNPSVLGWRETDIVGIGSELDTVSGDTTYTAYFNGTEVASWTDSANVVNTTATNRSQGFIFDMDGSLLTFGTGFKDILAYDTGVVAAPVGKIYVLWRDAYTVAS